MSNTRKALTIIGDYELELIRRGLSTAKERLVLDRDLDPFNAAIDGRMNRAEWFFEKVWVKHGQQTMHLRRLHYRLLSTPLVMPNGHPFINTDKCWKFMLAASRDARYLGLVNPTHLEEHRSPRAIIHARPRKAPTPTLQRVNARA